MKSKMNSYGKTWHVWNTGHFGLKGDQLPLGPARLAWSFNRDGEAIPEMVAKRDQEMDLSTSEARERRAELAELARPQSGVDALKDKFGLLAHDGGVASCGPNNFQRGKHS